MHVNGVIHDQEWPLVVIYNVSNIMFYLESNNKFITCGICDKL